jgi:hypothetical protein
VIPKEFECSVLQSRGFSTIPSGYYSRGANYRLTKHHFEKRTAKDNCKIDPAIEIEDLYSNMQIKEKIVKPLQERLIEAMG